MMKFRTITPILAALLLILIMTAPVLAWSDCPKGKINCDRPCRDYTDTNGNGICDRSESAEEASGSESELYTPSGTSGVFDTEGIDTPAAEPAQTEADGAISEQESVAAPVDSDSEQTTNQEGPSDASANSESVVDDADQSAIDSEPEDSPSVEQADSDNDETPGLVSTLGEPRFLVLLTLLILAMVAVRQGLPSYVRLGILAASLGYLGFYLKGCMCSVGVLANLPLVWQGIIAGDYNLWLALFLLPIVFAVFAGRIYCGGVCPFGAFQEFMFMLGGKLGLSQDKTGLDAVSWLKYSKYLFLLAVLVITPLTGVVWLCKIDPFGYLFNLSGSSFALGILVVVITASLLIFRPWCQYICPYGALLGIVAKDASLISGAAGGPTIIETACRKCGRCAKKCPVEAIEKGAINDAECINCGNCIKACKLGAVEA